MQTDIGASVQTDGQPCTGVGYIMCTWVQPCTGTNRAVQSLETDVCHEHGM